MTNSQHAYEVRPRKDHRGFDLISDALPFGRLWYARPNAVANVIGYATRDPASSLSQIGSIAHKSSFIPRPVRIVARQRTDFEDARLQKLPNVRAPLQRLPPREPVT
jgi:hypothetical protein